MKQSTVQLLDEPQAETDNPPAMAHATWLRVWLHMFVRVAIPAGILAAGFVAYFKLSVAPEKEQSPPEAPQVIRTNVTELHIQNYPVTIKTNGIIQSHNEVALNAQVSGQVITVSPTFEVGSYFSAGDALVELDDRDHKTALAVAEARYLGAWSALQLATVNLERNTTLFRRNFGSEAAVNQATAAREQASAELDSATAGVEQAKRDLERTKVRAPFDGRVRRKTVGLGQSVSSGTSLGVVFAVDFAEVRLPISGRELEYLDLPELPDDPPVPVELRDGIRETSETIWNGQIIRTEGTLDEDSLELFAVARIDDPFGRESNHPPLRIGQPVVASIEGKLLTDVVAIPRVAVRQLDRVFFVDKTELTLMSKTIDPVWSDEEHVIVRDPTIENGALLSTTHIVFAPDGAKVEIIPEIELTVDAAHSKTSDKDTSVAN